MQNDQETRQLINTAKNSFSDDIRKKVIDTLAEYGDGGIAGIQEIIDYSWSSELKLHGLEAIKRVKQSKK